MQNRFQPVVDRAFIGQRWLCAIALAALAFSQALFATAARSESPVSAWSTGSKSSMRLIAAPSLSASLPTLPWRVGIEIRLTAGALTYWRTPGGAGVAPVFDFANSVNVAQVEVAYPAPTRIAEEGTDAYGYQGEVIFPLRVVPSEANRPMTLALTLSYAVCDRICLPVKATAILDLPARPDPASPEGAQDLAIARAEVAVPLPLSQRDRDAKVSITSVVGAKPPSWRVVVHEGPALDLFAEAADGWYFETRKAEEPGAFLIVQAETPTPAGEAAVPVTLTLTGPQRSYEFGTMLDSKAAER